MNQTEWESWIAKIQKMDQEELKDELFKLENDYFEPKDGSPGYFFKANPSPDNKLLAKFLVEQVLYPISNRVKLDCDDHFVFDGWETSRKKCCSKRGYVVYEPETKWFWNEDSSVELLPYNKTICILCGTVI